MAIAGALSSMINSGIEGFESNRKKQHGIEYSSSKSWVSLVVFLIILLAIAFFGKILWNELLAGHGKGSGFFTMIKPLPSVWHAIAMYVTLDLFFGSS